MVNGPEDEDRRTPLPVIGEGRVGRVYGIAEVRLTTVGDIGIHQAGIVNEEHLVAEIVRVEGSGPRRPTARREYGEAALNPQGDGFDASYAGVERLAIRR